MQNFERTYFNTKIAFRTAGMDHAEAHFGQFHRIERTYSDADAAEITFIIVDLDHKNSLPLIRSHFFQCALNIVDKILPVLTADGETNQPVRKVQL
jgi:hypothetical protein